jgi:murein L,D-transpeptidase YcbB/YkuD
MTFRATALCAVVVSAIGCGERIDREAQAGQIRALAAQTPDWVEDSRLGRRLWAIARDFYEARDYAPAWVDGIETTPQWKDLVQQLKYSEAHGLDPDSYRVREFERLREGSQTTFQGTQFPPDVVPSLDMGMTYAYLRYAADLLGWTRNPRDVHRNWLTAPKSEDLAARLTGALSANRIRDSLEELAPTHPQYKGLQAALARDARAPSGRAGQLRMNLERWRWAPRDLGERYILINVPAYLMQVHEDDRPVMAMRVIVGDPEHQTPLFSDEMTYVVFSPYWNIPSEILRDETLPRVASDPEYLRRNNIEVVDAGGGVVLDESAVQAIDWSDEGATRGLRFRQAPGPENALGLVKFIFPNHFSVYLHDTPDDRLFFEDLRALSHGCIRVERPVDLAQYVLRDQSQWTEVRIRRAMSQQREQIARLKEPLPVHIGYWTAWVESDGQTVTYTDDPYGIDGKHAALTSRGAVRRGAE